MIVLDCFGYVIKSLQVMSDFSMYDLQFKAYHHLYNPGQVVTMCSVSLDHILTAAFSSMG